MKHTSCVHNFDSDLDISGQHPAIAIRFARSRSLLVAGGFISLLCLMRGRRHLARFVQQAWGTRHECDQEHFDFRRDETEKTTPFVTSLAEFEFISLNFAHHQSTICNMLSGIANWAEDKAAGYLKTGIQAGGSLAGNAVNGVGSLVESAGKSAASSKWSRLLSRLSG